MENLKFRRASILPSLLLAIAMLLPLPAAASAGQTVAAQGPAEFELASRVRAVLWPRPGSGTVLVAVAVPAGSQDEPPGMGGLSHYLEHLLFDGFDELDERGVTEAFERLSAYMNAFTREQATVFFALVPREEAEPAAALMAGMLLRSTIAAEVFEKERKVILEELAKDHASPDTLGEERLRAALWAGTPLAHPVGGTAESVDATTREEVMRFWRERYVPEGFRILVTGDLPLDGLQRVLAPFADAVSAAPLPPRQDLVGWPGWGEWSAAEAPEPPPAAAGPAPPMGMAGGHGMSGHAAAPAGGTLAVVVAAPNILAGSGTGLEVLARWLADPSGPLTPALRSAGARSVTVARLPRVPRDLLELRVEAELGADPESLLAATLGALAAAARGPGDGEAAAVQRAWEGERALNDQRLHYAAVFFGEALAAARGRLADAVAPPTVDGSELRAVAAAMLTDASARTRAAWLGRGGPAGRAPLPPAAPVPASADTGHIEAGPLGSLVATLDNGLVLGILPEEGSEVFGIHLLVADRSLREPAELPGAADLMHRLLLAGSAVSGSRELASRIRRAGLDLKPADDPAIPFDNRYHVPDFSYVRVEGPAAQLEAALTMLAETLRAPAWDEDGWREAVAAHRASREADGRGAERAEQIFLGALLGDGHPLARPVSGPGDGAVPGPEALRAAWGAWPGGFFAPPRLVLTVASPLPVAETLALVEDVLGGGGTAPPARGPYPSPPPAAGSVAKDAGGAPQVTLLWGRMLEVAPEDRAPLLMAMDALTDRMTAVIREREGLAYRLGAGVRAVPGGAWVASASVGTRPENTERVAALLAELATELGAEALPLAELERLNARERRSRMLRGLSAAARAYRVGR
ncbi:MAG: insulinase family protein, partial [Thermoanaerobaculales bacterium]|nr:insulinase family protein [Thermoanaerobaculales bacterium]